VAAVPVILIVQPFLQPTLPDLQWSEPRARPSLAGTPVGPSTLLASMQFVKRSWMISKSSSRRRTWSRRSHRGAELILRRV
jgi:hypothetical protein